MRLKSKRYAEALVFWLAFVCCFDLTPTYPTMDEGRNSFEMGFSDDVSSNEVASHETMSLDYPRSKRMISFLRQLFPGLSQLVDAKVRSIVGVVFKVMGQSILKGGGLPGGGGQCSTTEMPTDFDLDDNTITDAAPPASNASQRVESEVKRGNSSAGMTVTLINSTDLTTIDDRERTTVSNDDKAFASVTERNFSVGINESDSNSIDDSNSNVRRKRDSGLGSGHFLVDIIQLMAGSGVTPEKDEELNAPIDDFNDDSSNSTESSLPNLDKDDIPENHYNAEIPGPLTRLFVITNRALSKLMQDLILRLAQTSERIVNFKAKLITAII